MRTARRSSCTWSIGDEAASTAFRMWPIGKMPVLRDDARDRTIPESSIIIEYLAQHYPGEQLLPADPERALQVRSTASTIPDAGADAEDRHRSATPARATTAWGGSGKAATADGLRRHYRAGHGGTLMGGG